MTPPLTEAEAARLWALAYNTHDPAVLEPILAADVRVMSRWVIRDLIGRDAYLDYLGSKFRTFEQNGSVVRVETGRTPGTTPDAVGRPCALIEQDGRKLATVLFDVLGGRLIQVIMTASPPPHECLGSGEFPGFNADGGVVN
jgi:hypothetical protein